MTALASLLDSYLDLQTHFDPAAASAAGIVSADARLGAYDARSMREHLAAFRSIATAVEDLDLEQLEDEIDRTALLAELRLVVARFEQERPHVRNPGFWVAHAHAAVDSLLSRHPSPDVARALLARIAGLPDYFDAARGTIRRPPVLLVDAALARLGQTGELLVRAAAEAGPLAPGGPGAMHAVVTAALEALARFGRALRDEIEPEPEWAGVALGEARLHRRLEEAYAIRATPADLERWARELLESGDRIAHGAGGEAATGLDAAQDRARAAARSPVRRQLRSAIAVEGWLLYASLLAVSPRERSDRLREAAVRLLADIGLHAGRMNPAEAVELLTARAGLAPDLAVQEVRRIAGEPGSGLAAAAGYRELEQLWQAYAEVRGPDRGAFHEELLGYGALPPGLAGWGMGFGR